MPPDPPRQGQPNDDEHESNHNNIAAQILFHGDIMDDDNEFFVPGEGQHELDMDNSEESDWNSEIEDEVPGAQAASNNLTNENNSQANGDVRVRAHYQLLIPFPQADNNNENSQEEITYEESASDSNNIVSTAVIPTSNEESNEITGNSDPVVSSVELPKREITLTDDKVETIKNVMKNFVLPPTAVPVWAQELDEKTWKKQLADTIDNRNSPVTSTK